MNSNFWHSQRNQNSFTGVVSDPFFILAPMEDVTCVVFRGIVRKYNSPEYIESKTGLSLPTKVNPEVLFTEFTNCDGMCSVGQSRVIHRLKYDKNERPIVAQIWGKTPQNYYETAKLCLELGFDGIDINMGCPEKSVIKQGSCSALINNPELAKEIIDAVKRGVDGKIPVSVKTRIGFKLIQTQQWYSFLLEQDLSAITVHGRTVAQDELPANWQEIAKVVEMNKKKILNRFVSVWCNTIIKK
jgi:tRNA-dihydrouridine synthase